MDHTESVPRLTTEMTWEESVPRLIRKLMLTNWQSRVCATTRTWYDLRGVCAATHQRSNAHHLTVQSLCHDSQLIWSERSLCRDPSEGISRHGCIASDSPVSWLPNGMIWEESVPRLIRKVVLIVEQCILSSPWLITEIIGEESGPRLIRKHKQPKGITILQVEQEWAMHWQVVVGRAK